ncbi:MAG: DNA alkylation repair protein [Aureispira sp.]
MTTTEVLTQLEAFGDERTKKTLTKHGAREPFFGVKVADLKKILKKTKKNHELSLELYQTGNSDAMYLAGLMADEQQISKAQLQEWVEGAYWYYLSEYTVPWIAAETAFGYELALEWIHADQETVAAAGWSTLSNVVSLQADEELNLDQFRQLLQQVPEKIQEAPNRVKYTMNGFVIAVGCYVAPLHTLAQEIAQQLGKVKVDMNGTACKVPLATTAIQKVVDKDRLGKKRKKARC